MNAAVILAKMAARVWMTSTGTPAHARMDLQENIVKQVGGS